MNQELKRADTIAPLKSLLGKRLCSAMHPTEETNEHLSSAQIAFTPPRDNTLKFNFVEISGLVKPDPYQNPQRVDKKLPYDYIELTDKLSKVGIQYTVKHGDSTRQVTVYSSRTNFPLTVEIDLTQKDLLDKITKFTLPSSELSTDQVRRNKVEELKL